MSKAGTEQSRTEQSKARVYQVAQLKGYFVGRRAFRVCTLNPELAKRFSQRCLVQLIAKNSVIIKFADGFRACTGRENVKLAGSSDNTTSPRQFSYIVNLAMDKGLQCPASVSSWSKGFASRYIKYLLSLPDATELRRFSLTPISEQAEELRFSSESDMLYASQRRTESCRRFWNEGSSYFSDGLDDIPITKLLNAKEEES